MRYRVFDTCIFSFVSGRYAFPCSFCNCCSSLHNAHGYVARQSARSTWPLHRKPLDMKKSSFARSFISSLSLAGVAMGLFLFAASLTPSLIPRPFQVQGVLSGVVFMTGYGVGWILVWLWSYLELPKLPGRRAKWIMGLLSLIACGFVIHALSNATNWQNSIRTLMDMEPVDTAYPFTILSISLLTSLLILSFCRGLIALGARLRSLALSVVPRRVASIISVALLVVVLIGFVDKLFLRSAISAMDEAFAELNDFIEPDIEQPLQATASGSPESRIDWSTMGRRGREFTVSGPTASEISKLTGKPAVEPIRVYAGFEGEDALEAQAQNALDELLRLKAFERSVMVVATPTGTGWMDPGGVDTVEYLHNGDTAIVALQYSYLPSWTTLLIDPDRARRAARTLFGKIYGHWRRLPTDTRPELYLFGLSLGALGSEYSGSVIDLLNDPFEGALWSGPPFPSTHWSAIMNSPDLTGPAWLSELADGRLVRFAGPEGFRPPSRDGWGKSRILYIQHASDPMSFFSPTLLWRSPRWLVDRGPDVSEHLHWRPLVTFFQVGFDIFLATSVPPGHGHNIAPAAYIDGWVAVTDPEGWNLEQVEMLKWHFKTKNAY